MFELVRVLAYILLNGIDPAFLDDMADQVYPKAVCQLAVIADGQDNQVSLLAIAPVSQCGRRG